MADIKKSSNQNSAKSEYKSEDRLVRDSESGLLNYKSAAYYISNCLENMDPLDVCAMFVISIENFDSIKFTLGSKAEKNIVRGVAKELSGMFRASDIIGRVGENEFIVFISDLSLNKRVVLNKAKAVSKLKLDEDTAGANLTLKVGAHVASGDSPTFDSLYQQVRKNIEEIRSNNKKSVLVTCEFENKTDGERRSTLEHDNLIPVNYLIKNMNEGIRMLEMGSPIKQIYVSPNFFKTVKKNDSNDAFNIKIHPNDIGRYENMLKKAVDSEDELKGEYRVSLDGTNWGWRHITVVRIPYRGSSYPVILEVSYDISALKEKEIHLAESSEMLRIAFEHTTKVMWEVDIENKVYTFFNFNNDFDAQADTLSDFPESLIKMGWIHPDSAAKFREFGLEILSGKSGGSGSFIMRYRKSESYGWASLTYKTVYDKTGSPIKAVGVKSFLSDVSDRKTVDVVSPTLPDAVYPSLILNVKANLSDDSIKELWSEGNDRTDLAEIRSFSDIVEAERKKLFSTDDDKNFTQSFSREAMLGASNGKIVWRNMEYRRIDGSGNIRWVLNTALLVKNTVSQDVYLFNYLTDIERRRRWECEFSVEKDPVTGLYDKATAEAMIRKLLGRENGCAVALIQINGFSDLPDDEYGSSAQKQRYVSDALLFALGSDCVIGRYDEDALIAFFVDVQSRSAIKKRLEDAFAFLRSSMSGAKITRALRFVAGTICAQNPEENYEDIISSASSLCNLWKNSASDTVAFPSGNDLASLKNNFESRDDKYNISLGSDLTSILSEGEKDAALDCLSSIIVSNSTDAAVKNVLKILGEYYHADRVYILALAENNNVVTMIYDWNANGKYSIQRAVSGVRIEKMPFLSKAMEENKPIFMNNSDLGVFSEGRKKRSYWGFIALPITSRNKELIENGFLCIENPKLHKDEASLPSAIVSYVFNEINRPGGARERENTALDALTSIPDLRAYTDIIDSVNSDIYGSLGALALDVPDLPTINSAHGFEYGSKLILHIAEILSEIFGKSHVFRTWDSEFMALCPNTTMDAFTERCSRVRKALQQNYYKQIRIGYTWSDGVFYAKKLVKEAKAIMRCEHVKVVAPADSIAVWGIRYSDFSAAARNGKFIVYFQPKVDMTTDALAGAEALVRGVDDDGAIVPPGKFIDPMEKDGTIRDLDLFVLDRTFAYLEKWYNKGYDLIEVSVNISRITLLDPTAPASMLAIQSRYPDVLSGMIELEITESGCDIEKATLTHVMENFRQFGMKFGLDDFGSHYSNISIFTNVKFDTIKLDRSLINEISGNKTDRILVKNIIRICKNNGMTCVAEGVETDSQVAALLDIGCSICQGYYYDKPLPPEDFEQKWLENKMEEI